MCMCAGAGACCQGRRRVDSDRQSVGGFCGVRLTRLNLTQDSLKNIILSKILQPTPFEKILSSSTALPRIS
jgi:hypothetical protein